MIVSRPLSGHSFDRMTLVNMYWSAQRGHELLCHPITKAPLTHEDWTPNYKLRDAYDTLVGSEHEWEGT